MFAHTPPSYPYTLAEWGYAFVLPLEVTQAPPVASDREKLNLRDPVYTTDKAPILRNCQCYCCTNHTRAYIHHLLNTQEMLGDVLLSMYEPCSPTLCSPAALVTTHTTGSACSASFGA